MLRYSDGRDVRLGDHVDWDGTPGVVVDVVENHEHPEWATFNEPVVGFADDTGGTAYEAVADPGWESVVLIKRADDPPAMTCSPERNVSTCDRCGTRAPGKHRWMFYWYEWWIVVLGSPVEREFFCHRCLRIMRIYSVIGMTLLLLILGGALGAWLWLRLFVLPGSP